MTALFDRRFERFVLHIPDFSAFVIEIESKLLFASLDIVTGIIYTHHFLTSTPPNLADNAPFKRGHRRGSENEAHKGRQSMSLTPTCDVKANNCPTSKNSNQESR